MRSPASCDRGFTLVEALIATAIVVAVTALACGLALEAQGIWRGQSARVDLQQRARVAADAIERTLLEAGAGPRSGPARGSLIRAMAPVLPRRAGRRAADPVTVYRQDAFTVFRALSEAEHGILLLPLAAGGTTIDLGPAPSCTLPSCGFAANDTALLLDDTGHFDAFTVVSVSGYSLTLRHHGDGTHPGYAAGTPVLEAETSTFYVDASSRTLRRYDGDAVDFPVVDDVVEMRVEYFVEREPPIRPKPPTGFPNCLYESDGTYRAAALPVLSGAGAASVAAGANVFTDGPWCGSGASEWDADLLRVRRVRALLRLQAADPAVRGSDPLRFRQPGHARDDSTMVPDVTVTIDVVPRNLRVAW